MKMALLKLLAVIIYIIPITTTMSALKHEAAIETISPMGRPFQLGMLYDARNEQLIPGVTLWDASFIKKHIDSKPQRSSNVEVIAEDNLKNKFISMDISASMQLSFLLGLVKAGGSARYLDDNKKSESSVRVTLKYSSTTQYKSLPMEVLGNIAYPNVLDDDIATHVVAGIHFGGNAIFIFDREVAEEEDIKNIEGSMQVSIMKIPTVNIDGEAALKLNMEEREKTSKLKCNFYGDFIADKNPANYEEAVRLYQNISKLIEDDSAGRPVKVYLYPLNKLDDKKSIIVRGISNQLIDQVERNIEELHMYTRRTNDLLRKDVYTFFPQNREQLLEFNRMISYYKKEFQKDLAQVLPKIRGTGAEEVDLINILNKREGTPFAHDFLNNWINGKTLEMKLLKGYVSVIEDPNIEFVYKSGDFESMLFSLSQPAVVVLSFELKVENDELISKMENHLGLPNQWKNKSPTNITWYESAHIKRNINTVVKQFKELSLINTKVNSPRLIIASQIVDSNSECEPRASIKVYNEGYLLFEDFELPSEPVLPTATNGSSNTIVVKWETPAIGSKFIKGYHIQYQKTSGNLDEEKWEHVYVTETNCIINGDLTSTYQVQIEAMSVVDIHGKAATCIYKPPRPPPSTQDQFCSSMETLEINSNTFIIQQNSTDSQNLKLTWMDKGKKMPAEVKKGIKCLLEKSSKLQNLNLINFEESDLEEMEFPASLKGLRIDSHENRNGGKLFAKIQKETKEIEKLYFYGYRIERKEDLEALKEMGRTIQDLRLPFRMSGSQEISFLSEFPNLKKLYFWNNYRVEIDLFQLLSLIPKIENLLLPDYIIKEFKNADLSKLKYFGFRLIRNKHLENFEKFNSLERISFYDSAPDWNKTDEFWDSFFKILSHLENVEIIEFHKMNYEDSFYERLKSATQNREDKISIRMKNQNGKMIPKDENDKFIIEEWSNDDYWKNYWNLF